MKEPKLNNFHNLDWEGLRQMIEQRAAVHPAWVAALQAHDEHKTPDEIQQVFNTTAALYPESVA